MKKGLILEGGAAVSNPMDFYVVYTDIETGEAVYHNYQGERGSRF